MEIKGLSESLLQQGVEGMGYREPQECEWCWEPRPQPSGLDHTGVQQARGSACPHSMENVSYSPGDTRPAQNCKGMQAWRTSPGP